MDPRTVPPEVWVEGAVFAVLLAAGLYLIGG